MDGTLLNSNHEVSDQFFSLFEGLKLKNIRFVAASGRQYHSMVSKLDRIKDEVIFISENGAVIKEGAKEIGITPIKPEVIKSLTEIVTQIDGMHFMLCGAYTSYFEERSIPLLETVKEYYSSYQVVSSFAEVTDEIVKIAIYHPISAEKHIYPKLAYLDGLVKVKVSGQHWVDINHLEAHKGNAVSKVLQHYDLTPNEILVFGDYNNDIEMLALTDYSFAMANAHPNVLKVAKHRTLGNDAFGVEKILEKLI